VSQNGIGYRYGLVMVNWYYTTVAFVYTALIFIFFPIYLRNNVRTMPEFLGRRFSRANQDVFAVLLLLSYIFLSLPVVFYGGAKILQIIFPLPVQDLAVAGLSINGSLFCWLVVLALVATIALMVFSVLYSPVIEHLGGIFMYFQAAASYLAVPIATVFLFGIFWRRSTPAASLTILIIGIPLGVVIGTLLGAIPVAERVPQLQGLIPILPQRVIDAYSLDNFFVQAGITQIVCSIVLIVVSLFTAPRLNGEAISLMWSRDCIRLPKDEPTRPFFQSVGLWWGVFVVASFVLVALLW